MSKTIIITGASSGIGNELATFFHNQGHTVIGVSRSIPKDVPYPYFSCDLGDDISIVQATKEISNTVDSIDVLINCAGVGTGGAVEDHTEKDLLWVYKVNVLGVMTFTNQILPLLREGVNPKIINIGSVAGEITIPYQVPYSMTKSSITRYSEGLRMELKKFGIEVTTVLPGDTKTSFTTNRKMVDKNGSLYKNEVQRSISKMANDEQNGVNPSKVVRVIHRLIQKKHLPVQKVVGLDYKILVFLSKILPKKIVESIVRKLYG